MSEVKEAPEKELTKEEIAELEAKREAQKKELTEFYEAELPLLRLQSEYEECLTRIEIAKMQRFEIMMARTQMAAQQEQMAKEAPERKLKVEE